MKLISIYNFKGGCGKTTTVINSAYYLQKSGYSVLVADCDLQKNSFGFFSTQSKEQKIYPTKYEKVSLTIWDNIKNNSEITETFDYVILDLPPAMTDETREIIKRSDMVFTPCVLGAFEIQGLQNVTNEINLLGAKLGGVFITMFNQKSDGVIFKEVEKLLKGRLMTTIIPYSATVRESQKAGLSLEEYFDERNTPKVGNSRKIAAAYENLTEEILFKLEVTNNVYLKFNGIKKRVNNND